LTATYGVLIKQIYCDSRWDKVSDNIWCVTYLTV
jgi:hypothetical protein